MTEPLVYSLEHNTAPGLLSSLGAPAELIVRRSSLLVEESALSGSQLFVLSNLRGEAILSLAAHIDAAYEIEEGRFAGEIALQLSPSRSIQTTSLDRAHKWAVEAPSIGVGTLEPCPSALARRCESLLRSAWVTRTAIPQSSKKRKVFSGLISDVAVRGVVVDVLRELPLDSLERHYLHKSLSPIGSEAFRRIELQDPAWTDMLLEVIASNDPLGGPSLKSPGPPVDRHVDGALVQVNPDAVVARRFLPRGDETDLRHRLDMVERAEVVHQRTVRRLARGISEIGLIPLSSTSIDLAFALPEGLVILEVKSIHADNLESQLLSAVGQLLFYESELVQSTISKTVRGHIILASETPTVLPAACSRLADRAGVGLEFIVVARGDESPMKGLAEKLRSRSLWAR